MLAFFNWILAFVRQYTSGLLGMPFYGDVTLGYLFVAIAVMGLLLRNLVGRIHR